MLLLNLAFFWDSAPSDQDFWADVIRGFVSAIPELSTPVDDFMDAVKALRGQKSVTTELMALFRTPEDLPGGFIVDVKQKNDDDTADSSLTKSSDRKLPAKLIKNQRQTLTLLFLIDLLIVL